MDESNGSGERPFVAYYRVSTQRQGASGLGLAAQRQAVDDLVRRSGGKIVAEFQELESGANDARPKLAAAMATARIHRATLVVGKLDRLARSVAFLSKLMDDSDVDFVAADNPTACRLTIHILAAIAEHERRLISARTRDALRAAKARGTKLGSSRPGHWKGREDKRLHGLTRAREAARTSNIKKADAAAQDLGPLLRELCAKRLSLREMAARLNAEGVSTRRGKIWSATQVARVLRRIEKE